MGSGQTLRATNSRKERSLHLSKSGSLWEGGRFKLVLDRVSENTASEGLSTGEALEQECHLEQGHGAESRRGHCSL